MKVKWAYLKKPSVIIGAVILFFVLLFLLNRSGGSASSGTTTVTTGPSDAQVASQTQLALAQISAGLQGQAIQVDYAKARDANDTQVALATMAAALQGQSLVVQHDIASQTIDAQVHGLDLQYASAVAANTAQIQALQIQSNMVLASSAINANLQAQLSKDQLTAYGYNVAGGAISSANKGDRDQLTAQLIAAMTGTGVNYEPGNVGSTFVPAPGQPTPTAVPNGSNGQSGGVNILNLVSPISNLF